MGIYSPFFSDNSKIKTIKEIEYRDLHKLKENDIEEGFSIEYKSQWNSEFKSKNLCQTMTSFANSEGGWLFVGIKDDGTISEIKKERSDFSQTIAQCLHNHTSPIPKFECKFLKENKSNDTGVLVIYTPKSENTPCVCKGKVYIRSGSSKLPIASGRSEIDNLYKRREKLNEYIKEFCNSQETHSDIEYPYVSFYLYKDEMEEKLFTYEEWTQLFKIDNPALCRTNYCMNSMIFYNSNTVGVSNHTASIEFFSNGFVKVVIPLIGATSAYNSTLKNMFKKIPNIDLNNMLALDTMKSLLGLETMLKAAFEILSKSCMNAEQYFYCYEVKKIKNTFLCFQGAELEFIDFVNKNGFRISPKDVQKSLNYKFSSNEDWMKHIEKVPSYAVEILCDVFGYSFDELKGLVIKLWENREEKRIEGEYVTAIGGRITDT